MDLVTLAQIVTSVTNTLFVIVLAAGYYYTWRVSQQTLGEMREQRTAMGRPLVIVQEDYDDLPELDVAIRNVSEGAARDITFEFSSPIENSSGFVISDLPFFKDGLDFLPPQGELSCYWDDLNSLIPFLEARNLRAGITVTVRYRDLSGAPYESRWRLNPFLYKDTRLVRRKGIGDLVRAVEKLQE
ncbi:MAG: hypothetical protein AVDCRST_MAG12-2504 [uncultured Rubrobacteraceae bacterium]|uniref:Uncharacterized protein n=1 Tax=uncultured Rubrobacteraceae bacterium TaxID=349277 RepID=A0A6J4SMY7_9ACTN|nr:MAG: hypothetical protein AVDCRST_MAG12-2504 [uncultured Rubrobacteraceae bacterium]